MSTAAAATYGYGDRSVAKRSRRPFLDLGLFDDESFTALARLDERYLSALVCTASRPAPDSERPQSVPRAARLPRGRAHSSSIMIVREGHACAASRAAP